MPGILNPLSPDRAYMSCPLCEKQGTPNVPLTRDMHIFRCAFSHQFSAADLARLHPVMNKMSEIFQEAPDPQSIKWPVFVRAEHRDAFIARYEGRVHITLATMIAAMADGNVIFISGEDAENLKKRGLGNGASIVAALQASSLMEKERDDAIKRLTELMTLLRQSGVTE